MADLHRSSPPPKHSVDSRNHEIATVKDVLFVVLPKVVLLDLAGPAEAFRIAERRAPGSYRLRYVAPTETVRSAIGLQLGELEPLPDTLEPDTIVVLTGVSGKTVDLEEASTARLLAWLERGVTRSALLVCVCAGSVIAGKAGLLSGRECTTHHSHLDELRNVAPRAQVHDNRIFVEDGPVMTSAGVTAGLDLALHVIARQLGPRVAADVARDLVVYMRRSGADPALSPWVLHRNHLHPAVHRVQDAVNRRPTAEWTSRELSAVACTSARNLARLFSEHANCSPLDYVQLIRFAVAKELVAQSRLDIERVAAKAGFRSAQHLRRVWARWESRPPSEFRSLQA
jgi:transcriptional regulator GlxA family with amidase domain